jgi:hypothetical protein
LRRADPVAAPVEPGRRAEPVWPRFPVARRPVDAVREVEAPVAGGVADCDAAPWEGEPSEDGDDEPGTGPNAGGSGLTGRGVVVIVGVVMLGVLTGGVVTVPTVTDGTVTDGTETLGTDTVGTETVATETVGAAAEAAGTLTATHIPPHTARTVRRQRLTSTLRSPGNPPV